MFLTYFIKLKVNTCFKLKDIIVQFVAPKHAIAFN